MNSEEIYEIKVKHIAKILSGAAIDTLNALIEKGPLWDGDVPSKKGRDELLDNKCATKIIVNNEDGYQAATYLGRDVYKIIFNKEHL